jgi:RNA polymerase sigma factor (sigma-70 family)
MPKEERPFPVLLQEVRDGSDSSTRELIARYRRVILKAIRRHLDARVRPKVGCEDLEQEVWSDFFTHVLPREEFTSPEGLGAYLRALGINKALKANRKWLDAERRDVQREQPLQSLGPTDWEQLAGKGPAPLTAVECHEFWDRVRSTLPVKYQPIVDLLLGECTHEEIAGELGLSARTVGRIIRSLRRPPPEPQ